MPKQESTSRLRQAGSDAAPESKWYPTEHVRMRLHRNFKPKTAKLRPSVTPGTVLIVLSGRFAGKRVVFLKQLASGLLLVTGPYKVNGVPLRRLNQAYVIATSTKVNLEGVEVPAHIDDAYFARKAESSASAEARFMAQGAAKGARVSAQRKTDQKAVDAALLQKIQAEPFLRAYLNAKFSLTKGTRPHELKF